MRDRPAEASDSRAPPSHAMSQPHGLKLKLKLPSSAPADPPPSSDPATTAGSGVKLKLSLGATGIKPALGSGHGQAQEAEDKAEWDDAVGEAPVEPGQPTTKIKLNIGKLANHASAAESTSQTAPNALDTIKHEEEQVIGDNSKVNSANDTDTPAKRGRGAAARGKRGASRGTRGRGRGRPRGSGRGRGKVAVAAERNVGDEVDGLEMNDGLMDVDQVPEDRAEGKPVIASATVMQPSIKQDPQSAPQPTSIQADKPSAEPATTVAATELPIERPATPAVARAPPPTAPITSVTFAIPSPELSPAPSPSANTASQFPTPTIAPLTLPRRSVSVMSASGNPAPEGSGRMTTASETGTPTGGMDEPTEAMLADAAASGRVLFMGKGRPYLRTKKPLRDVLRKVLADIKRKDSVSDKELATSGSQC